MSLLEEHFQVDDVNLNAEKNNALDKIKTLQKAITECIPEIKEIYVDISSGVDEIYVHINEKNQY
ncbi:hypothetical protein [Snodgrassella alvi]|uniref:hypothetical protein n=1 Tax=Snodgrassella alvi TaxID=1196083 RepID=UPI001FD007BF|nr:hypothetical protein [Snodgrassella alvi]UOO97882.1 hypothetical protein LVJ87_07360 [Snodgrassella alvi wkB2]